MLQPGIKGRQEKIVTEKDTALAMGSGELPVFATPAMVALAEQTAWMSVAPELQEGMGTVGTRMDIRHLSATPVGAKVWCESTLTAVDRRKLIFHLDVYDAAGKIGEGEHERFIVQNESFYEKALHKLEVGNEVQ